MEVRCGILFGSDTFSSFYVHLLGDAETSLFSGGFASRYLLCVLGSLWAFCDALRSGLCFQGLGLCPVLSMEGPAWTL